MTIVYAKFCGKTKCIVGYMKVADGGCLLTLNLLHVSSCEMVTICDILHEAKQKTKTNSRECAVRTGDQL